MRILQAVLLSTVLTLLTGCSEPLGELKQPIPLEKIPADILKVAQDKYPDIKFDTAFTEVEEGQSVYELKGKTTTGKVIEVEVTKDGKILK